MTVSRFQARLLGLRVYRWSYLEGDDHGDSRSDDYNDPSPVVSIVSSALFLQHFPDAVSLICRVVVLL